ncbi:DUF4340 domain-containing protein [Marinoscillum sp. 108]|uniref:DUF4340 domain-containing protein n=1 Tax=Marinoscillum sp. 108 TaxID=2653151 RepID=UPI0012EF5C68|nr:DUF4340 domain-containing protein [Marinoscillum sp. 108]VXD13449.1 conserved hypothetical protein [Marinoscillum sp. 108]
MKGKKIVRLLVVLVVLVGVFLVVKYTGNTGRSKTFRSSLVEIDTAKVSKLEILSPGDTTVLTRESGEWKVNQLKKADKNTVKALMNNLKQIKPSRLASRTEDSWKDFQVDDAGTRVIAYEGSDKVLDIILGRFNVEGQRSFYSYVRLNEEADVYVAKDFMKMSVGTGSADYRNDDVVRLVKDSVSSIAFNYSDSAFTLDKVDGKWQLGEMAADSASVVKYLQSLTFVNSKNFAERSGAPVLYDLVIGLNGGNDIQVTAYGNDQFSSSYNEDEYWQDSAVTDKIFKGKSYFLGE